MKIKPNPKRVYHFKIDTNRFKIYYNVSNIKEGYYPHSGVTLREGIILLYKHPKKDLWVSIDAYHNSNMANVNMSHMLSDDICYEVLLYTPLLSDLDKLVIETDDKHHIEYIEENTNRKILVCGGPTSFGMGCTAVSLMFSNILARKLDANITNISYCNDDYLKKIEENFSMDTSGKYKVGIIELNGLNHEKISTNNLRNLIDYLNSHCDILIGWYYLKEINEVAEELLKEEIENNTIILKNISLIFNEKNRDMCSYGNEYINDSGNILIFKELFSTICEVTKWNI